MVQFHFIFVNRPVQRPAVENSEWLKGRALAEVQSLARGLRILDLLAQAHDTIGISEVAQDLGVDKSSAWRLLQTLVTHGYAIQDPESKRYRLGSHVVALSYAVLHDMPLRDQARDFLYDLVEKTGECAHMAVYSQGQALVIADVETSATLRVITGVGRVAPLHCTAVGKALLAFGKYPFPSELARYTPLTITDHQALLRHLQQTRDQGFALDDEELTLGVRCMAAPVYDLSGELVGSLGISGPTLRVTRERIVELSTLIVAAAHGLSNRLGYGPQPKPVAAVQD